MKRLRIVLLLAVALAAIAGGWYALERRNPTSLVGRIMDMAAQSGMQSLDGSKVRGNATQSGNALEEMVGLAIQGINLFQGDKGVELWRLKATWAHMSQNGGVIDVDKPVVRYALGDASVSNPDGDVLDVQAQKGRITDNQRFLTLWDDVIITRFEDTITSPRMDYDAATRMMTFPEGALLESPTASGRATFFTWNLQTKVMEGSGGVEVILKPRQAAGTTAETPRSLPQPPLQQPTVPSDKEYLP